MEGEAFSAGLPEIRANIAVFSEGWCAVLEERGSNGQLRYFSGSIF